ncbi:hypothetical protein D3C72_2601640 [compost metagenome]
MYKVKPDGGHATAWSLSSPLYGLDVHGNTLWGIGSDSQLYELPIGGSAQTHRYGLMGPTF